jgi:hypothetical protein
MSTEILKSEFGADQHPDETQLLLALERELPPAELEAIERHIGSCWECRARSHEMQRGILAFVEYRDKLYLPELELPPREFREFPSLLNKAAGEGKKPGFLDQIGSRIRAFLSFTFVPPQIRWVSATAAIMVAVLLWTQVLSPPVLSASELLTKAAESQNPTGMNHRKIHQRIRVKSGRSDTVREFQWETGSPIPGAKWGTDPDNWTAPMTAEGFSEWHNSLSAPKDKVKKSKDRWTLDTVAAAGPIKEASIVIRTGDFHPLEEHIRFSDDRKVDIEEVAFDTAAQVAAAVPAAQVRPAAPAVAPQQQTAPAASPVNLDEAELELRYAMFTQHLDEDEDLQISRTNDAVVLSGIASSSERLRDLQTALMGLPGVQLSASPPSAAAKGSTPAALQRPPAGASVPLLKDRLDSAFASANARRNFVDGALAASDSGLSHAWALKKLDERYTDADRRALRPDSQTKLDEMLRSHLQQLAAANATLNGLIDFLPPTQSLRADTRTGVAALFDLVQRQDSLVAALVAGTQTRDTVVAASDSFRSVHDAITRLTAALATNAVK